MSASIGRRSAGAWPRRPARAWALRVALAATATLAWPAAAAQPEALQPAVRTSTAALPAAPAPLAPATPATPAVPAVRAAPAANAPPAPGAAHDRVELDTTQITGNRELPNVMYVVPWKRPELGEFSGRPLKSLLDELLAPVDRQVFERQSRYYSALGQDAAGAPAQPAGKPAGAAARDPAAGRNAADER